MSEAEEKASYVEGCRSRLEEAKSFREVYELVKDTVKHSLGLYRSGMLLFLDDLPLQVGAYHLVGTNNIIMNRALLNVIQAATDSSQTVNAFTYSILLHEYLHTLGYFDEAEVRSLVYKISEESFGVEHVATRLARLGPWSLLKGIPLNAIEAPKRVIEIVKNLEKTDRYIV
jgi:hypothetical protein